MSALIGTSIASVRRLSIPNSNPFGNSDVTKSANPARLQCRRPCDTPRNVYELCAYKNIGSSLLNLCCRMSRSVCFRDRRKRAGGCCSRLSRLVRHQRKKLADSECRQWVENNRLHVAANITSRPRSDGFPAVNVMFDGCLSAQCLFNASAPPRSAADKRQPKSWRKLMC